MRTHTPEAQALLASKTDQWSALYTDTRAMLLEIVAIGEGNPSHPIIGQLARDAESYRISLDGENQRPHLTGTHGSIGYWDKNGRGPAIADMLRSARFHADRVAAAMAENGERRAA